MRWLCELTVTLVVQGSFGFLAWPFLAYSPFGCALCPPTYLFLLVPSLALYLWPLWVLRGDRCCAAGGGGSLGQSSSSPVEERQGAVSLHVLSSPSGRRRSAAAAAESAETEADDDDKKTRAAVMVQKETKRGGRGAGEVSPGALLEAGQGLSDQM